MTWPRELDSSYGSLARIFCLCCIGAREPPFYHHTLCTIYRRGARRARKLRNGASPIILCSGSVKSIGCVRNTFCAARVYLSAAKNKIYDCVASLWNFVKTRLMSCDSVSFPRGALYKRKKKENNILSRDALENTSRLPAVSFAPGIMKCRLYTLVWHETSFCVAWKMTKLHTARKSKNFALSRARYKYVYTAEYYTQETATEATRGISYWHGFNTKRALRPINYLWTPLKWLTLYDLFNGCNESYRARQRRKGHIHCSLCCAMSIHKFLVKLSQRACTCSTLFITFSCTPHTRINIFFPPLFLFSQIAHSLMQSRARANWV